jgi:AraC-like DNA-binding protein
MKPIYERLTRSPDEGFSLKEIWGAECSCPWHFHTEYELILAIKTHGYRIVGDTVTSLDAGDLVLLGPNLPHVYQHEDGPAGMATAHCILVQFEERSWNSLLELPAMSAIRGLMDRAKLGLQFAGRQRARVATLLADMVGLRGVRRITAFLEILDTLARCRSVRPIASPGFAPVLEHYAEERVNRVWEYINQRLDGVINVPEVARLVHMSEGAFSRFFRAHMGKSFPSLVNELRIGRACRLLTETERPVTEIALACGYRNLSNFNRQFLRLKKITPRSFRRRLAKG